MLSARGFYIGIKSENPVEMIYRNGYFYVLIEEDSDFHIEIRNMRQLDCIADVTVSGKSAGSYNIYPSETKILRNLSFGTVSKDDVNLKVNVDHNPNENSGLIEFKFTVKRGDDFQPYNHRSVIWYPANVIPPLYNSTEYRPAQIVSNSSIPNPQATPMNEHMIHYSCKTKISVRLLAKRHRFENMSFKKELQYGICKIY